MNTAIPSPRDLLTRLITSLPSIPIADNASTTAGVTSSHRPSNQYAGANQSSNPLKLIPPASRSILTTLHVLYPSTLLPALDLLDRRLVTRVILKQNTARHPSHVQTVDDLPISSEKGDLPGGGDSDILGEQDDDGPRPLYHLVRSAQPQSHRRHHAPTAGGQVYVVRLESWNCTCAAFAFAAFPPLPSSSSASSFLPSMSETAAHRYQILPAAASMEDAGPGDMDATTRSEDAAQTWEFGGLSTDGKDGAGGVPCCKHLLACVLAEKWGAVLGGYVEERLVGREEAAGLIGEL
ncbi:hypothetical protein F4802DRAFT_60457 [Xylaria palmicola]|nr:hypothetical protein F4802DRAFT_60457 [Xylaria palmicola]